MRRYGDNVTIEDFAEVDERPQNTRVMFGGCGVNYGSFSRPVKPQKKNFWQELLSLIGFKQKEAGEK
jgi:hypothetical protein